MKHFIIEDLQTDYIRITNSEKTFSNLLELGVNVTELLAGEEVEFNYMGDVFKVYFIAPTLPFQGVTKVATG